MKFYNIITLYIGTTQQEGKFASGSLDVARCIAVSSDIAAWSVTLDRAFGPDCLSTILTDAHLVYFCDLEGHSRASNNCNTALEWKQLRNSGVKTIVLAEVTYWRPWE